MGWAEERGTVGNQYARASARAITLETGPLRPLFCLRRARLDQSKVAALAPIEDIHARAARVHEDDELPMRHLELQDGFIDEHRLYRITLRPHDRMMRFIAVVAVQSDRLRLEHVLFQMMDEIG